MEQRYDDGGYSGERVEDVPSKGLSLRVQTRIIYTDLLRIIATFGVVAGHTSVQLPDISIQSSAWRIMSLYACSVRWTVPVFIMISGMFHLRSNGNPGFADELRVFGRKTLRLVYGLVFCGVLYTVFSPLLTADSGPLTLREIARIPYKILSNDGSFLHLWFVYTLIGLYLLTPLLRPFIRSCTKRHIEYGLLLFLIVGACIPTYNALSGYINEWVPLFPNTINLPLPEVSGYAGYYIAGYYFAEYRVTKKTRMVIYILGIFSWLFTVMGTIFLSLSSGEQATVLLGFSTPNCIFIAYAVFLWFQNFFSTVSFSSRMRMIITKISGNTYGIYLLHILMIQLLVRAGVTMWGMNDALAVPVISLMVFILSCLGTVLLKAVPVLRRCVS